MTAVHVANYSTERDLLSGFGTSGNGEIVLLMVGPPDFGKTWLLRWFQKTCGQSYRVSRISLEDPEREVEPLVAMNRCAAELGWDNFPTYGQSPLRRPVGGQVSVRDVVMSGSNNILTARSGVTPPDQLAHAIDLTRLFVQDLAAAAPNGPPVVLCLDGYGSASWLTRRWIEQALVAEIVRTRCARLILTSRERPAPAIFEDEDSLLPLELGGVRDVDEWMRVADELCCCLPGATPEAARERMLGAIDVCGGEPGMIMQWLKQLPRRLPG